MSSKLALAMFSVGLLGALLATTGSGQPPTQSTATPTAQPPSTPAGAGNGSEQRSWVARDPLTGRLFQQELVTQTVPTTQWEVRPVTTTVYEPRQVVTSVPSQQVTYTPTTQYVMQPRLKGWWNPLQQPVQTYEFVPVTSWQPQTQTVQQPVTTTQWVPRQQVVYVPQAVQRMQTQQQIVSRELPQPSGSYVPSSAAPNGYNPAAYAPATMMAAQPRPLVTIPLLAQQRILPWPSGAPANAMRNMVGSGLRPISNAVAPTYSAPLQSASSASSQVARDPMQSGMSATILR